MCFNNMSTFLWQVVGSSILQLYKRSTFILLVPLLMFNGFEQGFVYSDYTKVWFSLSFTQSRKTLRFNANVLGRAGKSLGFFENVFRF